jgi:hypothetical protein
MTKIIPHILTPEEITERVQSDHVPIVYYNYVRTAASFFDMRLFFGQSSVTPKSEQTFEEQLCVACTPEFAKTLRDNLIQVVEKYEKTFGEIRKAPNKETLQAAIDGLAPKPPRVKSKKSL